ncbi:cyclase family protein [Acidisoma sp. S159]|uniref:cyclase family protein n=1 Tax=Acidisoma sp. S159 TaxID=1747225 RepID=UPI00131B45D5|nr:cyclase family protein [Acidisoma sp. S159]
MLPVGQRSHDHRAANLMARSMSAGFRAAEAIDLSRKLENGIPTYPTHPKFFKMCWCAMGDPARMNQFVLSEHTGTHIDAPSHFMPAGSPGADSIDALPLDRFMGPAIKMTFGPFAASNVRVGAKEIRDWEQANVAIEAGDIVLIDFRWGHRWGIGEAGQSFLDSWPGVSRDAAEYLAERRVKLVGTDCISLDPGDGGGGALAAHYTLLPQGILIMENACNLERLDVISYVMALPLRLGDATGSPVRAVGWNIKRRHGAPESG